MVKLQRKFIAGDKVFAKVRGYPPWPAKVESVTDANTKNAKYNVYFYGTGETAVCKVEELFAYADNKAKFGKPLKRKFFHEGLQELEDELESDGNTHIDKGPEPKDKQTTDSLEDGNSTEQLLTVSASDNAPDSDAEGGALVIDEGEKKKTVKRKASSTPAASNTNSSTPSSNQATPEVKKKRGGRTKATSLIAGETPNKHESLLVGQDDDMPSKEVVSRSGRKIKPKRFADFSSSDKDTEKYDNSASPRVLGKGKLEDTSVKEVSPPRDSNKANKISAAEKKIDETNEMETDGESFSTTKSADTQGRFLLARTFAGEYVGIKLDVDRPKSFENENARTQWDWETATSAMKLKAQLESGAILPEQVKNSLDFNVHASGDDTKTSKDNVLHHKKYKLRWLRIESQLLQLDAQIKSNLALDKADADKCLHAMDDMLALPIDPLMLKKHPHIVETVRRLRRYIGNLAEWKLTEEEAAVFKQKAEQIKQKAEHIYNKFKAMFTISGGQTFWQSFSDQVIHFKELTKDMPEETMFSLMADPSHPVTERAFPLDSLRDGASDQTESINETGLGEEAGGSEP
ncbi:PC4 and SFRS1-interacting protein [Neodiprion pinetum]|uniref:PC4 and SFRS1-interacting protein n=1 Tax=Neodiprion lecontei TaxID=441921 RepID=A0A6J0BP97_NEOLC|nr:PC4 and SFRS1-interacting protein [Neodiprion lecontei]XP_015516541.1 PC4 and SFRS1-interacting protein [Neodiprion lecontei]XP_046422584.1 PC4 and SFRS1-interacting protein [Neodiprion fabricii]XP_046422585.1 PC4 and SFRS1-interacting protein [Neodiprion fabricii]XP_046422586.1 PC4 and SFRS1-interacting protein [Neodiprion fabricii]XP_046480348.1 PC4 and SFRS1-interacting protein [Neodiprion pinetum]XP_046480350.1 PC4 and SFRS1-interacting protein [Neodiprion pinetum]XP_046480351.1 PC4 a